MAVVVQSVLFFSASRCSAMFVLLFLYLLSGVSAQNFLYLSLNDVCKDGPIVWRCKSLGDCPKLKEMRQKGQRPDVCSFEGPEPIICCPPATQSQVETTTTGRTTTRPLASQSTKRPYWWTTNRINEEEGPVWGSWTTKPTVNTRPNQKKPTHQTKSKAEKMCEEYSQYVYRVGELPPLLPNQKPDKIKFNECNMANFRFDKILSGVTAMPKEFPHMALIGYGNKPRVEWLCGGSLISSKFVLSAAHCTKTDRGGLATWVRLGDLDTSIDYDDAEPVELKIIRHINHPQYNNQHLYHDIALYELERELKLNTYIRPLCLYTGDKDLNARSALASGWGLTSLGGRESSFLLKVNLTTISNEKCNNQYGRGEYKQQLPNGIVDDLMLCAGGQPGKDSCQGDSGGPLQIEHKNVYCMYSQIGVVSFGRKCGLTHPGVYTRVSNYVEWIESIVWP